VLLSLYQIAALGNAQLVDSPFSVSALDSYQVYKHIVMQEGTITRVTDKGFGFIKIEGEEKDLFFHSNELIDVDFDSLREGDKVKFEVADSPKGKNAVKITRI
jgi:cold shock protein